MHKNTKDLTGQQFGLLTVVRLAREEECPKTTRKKVYWMCDCKCGRSHVVAAQDLTRGMTRSCGCLSIRNRVKLADSIVGKKFGRLEVLSYTMPKGEPTQFECLCDCGRTTTATKDELESGHKTSCGCRLYELRHKEFGENKFNDITGQKFGRLTAISPTELRDTAGCVIWECKCECGNIAYVSSTVLMQGATQSCGCMISRGEEEILRLLIKNQISYEHHFSFKDLRSNVGGLLYFDFAIKDENGRLSHLIEYDGNIHFGYSGNGWDTKERYEEGLTRDKLKNEYCIKNNIPLIRIPYTHFDDLCLQDLLLESTDFLFC